MTVKDVPPLCVLSAIDSMSNLTLAGKAPSLGADGRRELRSNGNAHSELGILMWL